MNRFCLLPLFFLLATALSAQTEVTLTATVEGCKRPLFVYAFDGNSFSQEQVMTKGEGEGVYVAKFKVAEPIFRYIGSAPADAVPVIIGGENEFKLAGRCGAMRNAITTGSMLNKQYSLMKKQFSDHQTLQSTLIRSIMTSNDDDEIDAKTKELATLDLRKRELVKTASSHGAILGRIASLNTYLSYQNADAEKYQNEIDYYVNTYFQFVDFNDPGYNDLPWTYEGNRNFATNLTQVIQGEQLADLLNTVYTKWPEGSRAQFLAMSGGFAALSQRKHPAAAKLGQSIVDRFSKSFPKPVADIARQTASLKSFSVGGEAPLFTGLTPEGDSLSLESLRGKVVLLDFWASWCGPCRRENPNVVRVYQKYKDRGFEILGVSLDQKKDKWLQAIEADKLTWLHVSDLKGWQSAYGRLYGVTSIPQTVLLDRQGNIIARNLRGAQLEQKLEDVFNVK